MKIGFDEIRLINALDSIARVSAKDCFVEENTIVYLVPNEGMRKAIGKNGSTIEKVKKQLGKNIELYEYSSKPEEFFSKAFHKASVDGVEIKKMKQRNIAIVKTDNANKRVILQNLGRLNKVKELAKRNYDIEEVRIR